MSEPVDEITHSMSAGFIQGVNRSRALGDALRGVLADSRSANADSRSANESVLRAALSQARIAATVLEADQKTQRHDLDVAGRYREQQRRDEELEWKRDASVQASARETGFTSARIGEVNLRGRKVVFDAFLSALQDERRAAEHKANLDLANARTATARTEEEIKVAEFVERQTDREAAREFTEKKNTADLDLRTNRETRDQQRHDLEMQLTQQRIDKLQRADEFQTGIAHQNSGRKASYEAAAGYAAAEGSADQGAEQQQRADAYRERVAADAEIDPDTFTTQAQSDASGPAPDPEFVEAVATAAEDLTAREFLRDRDGEQKSSEPGVEDGTSIGETISSAVPSPEATAAAGVQPGAAVSAERVMPIPALGAEAENGPGAT